MTGMKPLPPFAYKWVGGDIWGLDQLQAQCERVVSAISDSDHALSRQVSAVVDAESWSGKAADAFISIWDKDSRAGMQLADAWMKIGSIVGDLAAELAALENALERAADELEKQGIPVDEADGMPLPDSTLGGKACPSPQLAAARGELAMAYGVQRTKTLTQATEARARAAHDLDQITQSLLPPGTDWGQLSNDLDSLRSLWAIPTEYRKLLQDKLPKLNKVVDTTQRAAWEEYIAARKLAGNNARLQAVTKENASNALKERAGAQGKIESAPENALTKMADGDAEGLGLMGFAATGVKAIPIVGTAAGTGITIYQDLENHESVGHAVIDGLASNGAGFGAGLAVTGGVAAGVTIIGGAPVVAVAAGTVVGVGAAVGVSDFVHNVVQENWGQDWHQHGVLAGTAHGIADSWDKTRHDMAHYLDDLNPF